MILWCHGQLVSWKCAGPDHPWAHFSKHSMSSVLSIHQESHINNESSVSAATQNFWKEQNLTTFPTKLSWPHWPCSALSNRAWGDTPLPHPCENTAMPGTKGNTDTGHSPFHRASLEHSHMDTQCHQYHPCRLLIWAGCSVILTIFNPGFVHPSGAVVVHPPLPCSAFLQLSRCPCWCAHPKEGSKFE